MKFKSVFTLVLVFVCLFSLCSCTIEFSADSGAGSLILSAVSDLQGEIDGQTPSVAPTVNATAAPASPETSANTESGTTAQPQTTPNVSAPEITPSVPDTSASGESSPTKGFFTNLYGTPTTQCAHRGCSMYIVASGNSNCCRLHSGKCSQCGIFINEGETLCEHCSAEKTHA